MRLSKHKRPTRADMNMTPMIDITFLLLIFFMTVTQISETNKKQMKLPDVDGSKDQKPTKLIINIDESGAIEIGGRPRTIVDVHSIIADEINAVGGSGSAYLVSVTIRADQQTPIQPIDDVLALLSESGINHPEIAVVKEK